MSTTTTHPGNDTDEAPFLAPETHQRAEVASQDQSREQAAAAEGDLRMIPLSRLVLSPMNARKAGGENIDELAMLIDAQGLLQNLVVIPHVGKKKQPTDRFEVVAGGRRLRALKKLAELGKVGKDEPIACKLTTKRQAIATSAAENSGREAMSVADTVQAFADMVATGAGVEDVAVCFGITPLTVKRRLKLANVSPRLFELFRQDEMNLDQLMALAISDDQAAQERVWDGMDNYERSARNLRRQLLGREIDAGLDPVALFVGIDAYKAAGGAITCDLFAEEDDAGYIADTDLLFRLAKERLDTETDKLKAEGWKWVEGRASFDYSERHAFGEAPMGLREPTEKEQARLDALAQEQDEAEKALEALYAEDEDDIDQKQADALEHRAQKASRETDKLHAKMRRYAPEVLALAGTVVTIEHGGSLVVYRGLVKPEDRRQAKRLGKRATGAAGAGATDAQDEGSAAALAPISEALHRKLTAHRTKALQVLVADNAHAALASVVHALAQRLVIEHGYGTQSALSIRGESSEGALQQAADDIKGSKADIDVQSRLDNWRERIPGDADRLLPWLIGQNQDTLLDLLALCAALSINTVQAETEGHPGDAIAAAVGLDMADWWAPTATSYLQQVPKARIVEAVSMAVSVEAAAGLAKLKKGEAVAKAEALLAGTRWLPEALRAR